MQQRPLFLRQAFFPFRKIRAAIAIPSAILSILCLSAALRLHNLTYHSLWYDEAVSVRWARSSVARILDVGLKLVEDRLPPLYYLLLKGWGALGGFSEFSLRFPSVVAGVLLVAVVYALGRRLFGRGAGLAAALLAALNPFLVWYSQEARMYALSALLGALGVLCFVRAMERPRRWGYWFGLGACALAGLYTHLYSGF
ncbi:MAG: phospholipid carrier-dependent glycosyltransferase, partial [Caldilineae bacterium]